MLVTWKLVTSSKSNPFVGYQQQEKRFDRSHLPSSRCVARPSMMNDGMAKIEVWPDLKRGLDLSSIRPALTLSVTIRVPDEHFEVCEGFTYLAGL